MTTTQLKWIAIITMIIDHVGAVFFKELIFLKFIGRLAFPIFAFLIAEGYVHTRDANKYALRLFLFAIISEIPFDLAFNKVVFSTEHQNVFFTLFFGLIALMIFKKVNQKSYHLGLLSVYGIGLIAEFLRFDYGIFGVFMIFFVFQGRTLREKSAWIIGLNLLLALLLYMSNGHGLYQALAGASVVFITLYNGQKGNGIKYLFYGIYPVHLLILYLIQVN